MKKILDIYEKIIDWVEIILNVIIIGVVGLQIITRSFFNMPLKFPEEVSTFVMIAMVFVGISIVEKYNAHLKVEFLQDFLPKGARKWLNVIGRLLILVLVIGILAGELQLFPQIMVLKTHAAGIPYPWLHATIVVFSVLWGAFSILGILYEIQKEDKPC